MTTPIDEVHMSDTEKQGKRSRRVRSGGDKDIIGAIKKRHMFGSTASRFCGVIAKSGRGWLQRSADDWAKKPSWKAPNNNGVQYASHCPI